MRSWPSILVATALLGLGACGEPTRPARAPAHAKPHVYTTFYPTTYFTRRIAGDRVAVICPLPADEDPAFWEPPSDVIAAYQDDADLIVVNGAGMEKWVALTSLPEGRILDTLAGHEDRFINYGKPTRHAHGGKVHVHRNLDGHTWVDPTLALVQARAIHDELARRWPKDQPAFDRGFQQLEKDLEALDAGFRALGSQPEGAWIYAAHPTYAYAARTYGWRVEVFGLEPDARPDEARLDALAKSLEGKPGRTLWWENAPDPAVAEAVRKRTGLRSLVFSPCEAPPAKGDYLGEMKANIERVRPAFRSP